MVIVEYHLWDPFETLSAPLKQNYYNVNFLPTSYFDGVVDGIPTSANYEQRKNIPSDFTINVEGANSQQIDYVVNVTVEKVAVNNSQNLRLMFALTETDIPYYWMGQEKVNFCERFMLPDASGTNLDFSEDDILEFSFTFSIDTAWVQENCELAVWIQNLSNREIQQGAKRSLDDFGGFPVNEAKLANIYSPVTMCNNSFEPGVEVENLGSSDITSIDIVYQVNNEPEQIYNWTGNIPFTESLIINLPEVNLSVVESDIFTVYLENPNNQADEFPYNDTLSNVIMAAENISSPVILVLKLDDFPEQTSWELLNSNDIVLYSANNYTVPNVFVTETFDLESNDCYSFKIYDENGDGLTGTGLFKLMNGTNIFQTGKAFGYMDEVEFGIDITQIPELNIETGIRVYPNPVSGVLNIKSTAAFEFEIIDVYGRIIINELLTIGISQVDLSNQLPGIYYLRMRQDKQINIEKIIIR